MKPEIRALLMDAFTGQAMKYMLLATVGPVLACGWFLYQVLNTRSNDSAWLPPIVVAVALFMIVVTAIVLRFLMQGVAADEREETYLRTSGPPLCTSSSDGDSLLETYEVGGQSFTVGSELAAVLERCAWATVDHTRHASLISAVRDEHE